MCIVSIIIRQGRLLYTLSDYAVGGFDMPGRSKSLLHWGFRGLGAWKSVVEHS